MCVFACVCMCVCVYINHQFFQTHCISRKVASYRCLLVMDSSLSKTTIAGHSLLSLGVHRSFWSVYRSLLGVHRSVLGVYGSLLGMYRSLLGV